MPLSVQVALRCEQCEASCVVTAPLVGRRRERLRVDLSEAKLPKGWWVGVPERWDRATGPACGCPAHAEFVEHDC
jgi:hypothetical protein